jgi:hypothetical protein
MSDEPVFRCLPPCQKIFNTEKKLILHYKNRPSCKEQWREYEQKLALTAFEEVSLQRQAQVRELVTKEALQSDEESRRVNAVEGE